MMLYKIFLAIDGICTLIMLYFLYAGFSDNTVNERNGGLWLGIIALAGAVLGVSVWLRSHGYPTAATLVSAVIAIPALLYAIFILVLIFSGTKWQ